MKNVKKVIRLFMFICLIVLAVFGIGMSGGVPLSMMTYKRDAEKDEIELVEEQEEDHLENEKQM